ncbi:hypothetical protein [Pseudomonas sp. S9]|uniref:hypothetical protein n=1 Tax=Pseudomonas sp. S9 TaxID=686578 RepID=UPI0002556A7C|nr:hypothetical protein [Pseudomonas sp. S9]
MPNNSRVLLQFVLAVLVTTLVGSILQTQYNLAQLQALGAPMPIDVRVETTCLDVLGFSPVFAILVLLGFACALPMAAWLSKKVPDARWMLFALAGALGIFLGLTLVNAVLPMPTFIGANRSFVGTLGLMASGSVGALFFAVRCRTAT